MQNKFFGPVLANRIFWLILIVASLAGRLYAHPSRQHSTAGPDLFNCSVCDTNLRHAGLDSILKKQALPATPFSRFSDDATDIWYPVFDTHSSAFTAPPGSDLFSVTSGPLPRAAIALWPGNELNPPETQDKKKPHSPFADNGSPGHIFWVIPAFKVDYAKGFEPLTPKEKFKEWAQSSYDPMGLTVGAFEAGTLEY